MCLNENIQEIQWEGTQVRRRYWRRLKETDMAVVPPIASILSATYPSGTRVVDLAYIFDKAPKSPLLFGQDGKLDIST